MPASVPHEIVPETPDYARTSDHIGSADSSRPRFGGGRLIGESPAFLEVVALAEKLSRCEAPALITGATGTGKELFARAIHYAGPRSDKPFVALNCAALPESLAENELFGHSRGAYTHAESHSEGLVAAAEGGTLFLDEVDSLSLGTQAKLLRFLQDLEYRPLGESRSRRADVRLLTATNAELGQRVAAGQFRSDLFYRLNVLRLRLPALARRRGDVPLLARHLLAGLARRHGRAVRRLSSGAMARLEDYAWPGNVRELEAILQRALLLAGGPELRARDLDLSDGPSSAAPRPATPQSFRAAKAKAIDRFELDYLSRVLRRHRGNVSQAAKTAGKERSAFQRLMRKHGLERGHFQV